MKTLNVQDRLEYARCAVGVLRALQITDQKMRYEDFARAIGLIADNEKWQPWHRQQTDAILQTAAAVERQGLGGKDRNIARLEFDRIVNRKGRPGAGIAKNSRIVRKP
jgi:hypothetical protein